MDCFASLKQNPLFEAVPDDQLRWLVDRSECLDQPADTIMYRPGDPTDHFFIVLKGRIRLYSIQAGQQLEMIIWTEGNLAGVLPFSRMKQAASYWETLEPVTVLALHRDHFKELIQTQYELTQMLVQQLTTRVRDSTRQMQQNDKMMSLGRLSAGLAHELNNPVAAIVRSSDTLKSHLRATPEQFKGILAIRMQEAQVDVLNDLMFNRMKNRVNATRLSLMERNNLENDLLDWLEDHQVSDAYDLTEPLIDFNFTVDDLEIILESVGPESLPTVVGWIVNNLVTEKLVIEIEEASQRIATLIGAIKSYTHMDRGTGKESVQLREGIDTTLTLLKHKLKEKHIDVDVSISDGIPRVQAFASELNQVWTNLIDNAIDAMNDGGKLQIKTEIDRNFVLTHIIDNGTGIPSDVVDRIFDPFFTTKEIGKGTGLGLDIVQGIIRHHNGKIYVDSKPGRTEFKVCLPMNNE